MLGFFKKKDTRSLKFTGTKNLSCFSCGLYKTAHSPKMEPFGNFKKKIMVIGDVPGERDDQTGKPFQGKVGRLLQKTLEDIGIDLFEDCISLNAVNCAPPDSRTPTQNEVNCCRDVKVLKAINELNPKMILILGGTALTSLLGPRWKSSSQLGTISKWRGWTIPDQDYKTWICPTFSPAYVEKMDSKELSLIWREDLENAFKKLKEPFPIHVEPNVRFIEDLNEISLIPEDFVVAFDYETTGKKPQAKGHKIVCASIAYSDNDVMAFMMPERKSERKPFIDFLQSNRPKVASNMKFEDTWSNVRLGSHVSNWFHDTMLESHVLDYRTGTTGLKFQSYVNFGVIAYDEEEKEFLKTKDEDNNALNKIFDLVNQPGGKESLLQYCAMDSILEYRLAMKQIKQRNDLLG
jgi:Uracil-DNA glycosylase